MSRISTRRGSHRMLRLPSARGPHSIRPWNQPTTLPFAISAAVRPAESVFLRDSTDVAAGAFEFAARVAEAPSRSHFR